MRSAASMLRLPARIGSRLHARVRLSRMRRDDREAIRRLAKALGEALQDDLSRDERRWVDRVEALRAELELSTEEILITDYGAGGPNSHRSDEAMNQGVTKARTIGEVCRSASKPYFWSVLLFKLIREFKPSMCLELGTAMGISGAYQASALKLEGEGRIISMEGSESLASIAQARFHSLGLDNIAVKVGRFSDTLEGVLEEEQDFDYVFIDGHHDEHATCEYFEMISPHLSEPAIIVFDDISWSPGMKRAWASVRRHHKVGVSVNLRQVGICLAHGESSRRSHFNIPLP